MNNKNLAEQLKREQQKVSSLRGVIKNMRSGESPMNSNLKNQMEMLKKEVHAHRRDKETLQKVVEAFTLTVAEEQMRSLEELDSLRDDILYQEGGLLEYVRMLYHPDTAPLARQPTLGGVASQTYSAVRRGTANFNISASSDGIICGRVRLGHNYTGSVSGNGDFIFNTDAATDYGDTQNFTTAGFSFPLIDTFHNSEIGSNHHGAKLTALKLEFQPILGSNIGSNPGYIDVVEAGYEEDVDTLMESASVTQRWQLNEPFVYVWHPPTALDSVFAEGLNQLAIENVSSVFRPCLYFAGKNAQWYSTTDGVPNITINLRVSAVVEYIPLISTGCEARAAPAGNREQYNKIVKRGLEKDKGMFIGEENIAVKKKTEKDFKDYFGDAWTIANDGSEAYQKLKKAKEDWDPQALVDGISKAYDVARKAAETGKEIDDTYHIGDSIEKTFNAVDFNPFDDSNRKHYFGKPSVSMFTPSGIAERMFDIPSMSLW